MQYMRHTRVGRRTVINRNIGYERSAVVVEKGYQIVEVYEVHKYDVIQYNPATGIRGYFAE